MAHNAHNEYLHLLYTQGIAGSVLLHCPLAENVPNVTQPRHASVGARYRGTGAIALFAARDDGRSIVVCHQDLAIGHGAPGYARAVEC